MATSTPNRQTPSRIPQSSNRKILNNNNISTSNNNNNNQFGSSRCDDIFKHYHIHDKKLGEGGFAKVRLATHLATKQFVAIKCLNKAKLGPELPRIYNEIECLKKLKHRNIAQLYQVFETQTDIFLVLEYCAGGELFDYIVKKSKLSEQEAAQIIHDLMQTLDFIHINGFAHRDLKPENVLFDDKHQIKLIDFGLAANCSADHMAQNRDQAPLDQLSTCCGSVTYAAPEIISGDLYCGTQVDVWSAGVMLYALLVGQLPFNDNNIQKLYQKIQAGIKTLPSFLSKDACDLIRKMLTVDPRRRITVREVLSHPWIRNKTYPFARVVNRRLDFTPNATRPLGDQIVSLSNNNATNDLGTRNTPTKNLNVKPGTPTKRLLKDIDDLEIATKSVDQENRPVSTFAPRSTPKRSCGVRRLVENSAIRSEYRSGDDCNSSQTPRMPMNVYGQPTPKKQTIVRRLFESATPSKTPGTLATELAVKNGRRLSAFVYDKPATGKKSIVKRLIASATPKKLKRLRNI